MTLTTTADGDDGRLGDIDAAELPIAVFLNLESIPIRGSLYSGGDDASSGMVSGIFTAGGFGRETVERRRGLSRPLRGSTLTGEGEERGVEKEEVGLIACGSAVGVGRCDGGRLVGIGGRFRR